MPTVIFAILVLVLALWALNVYSKADPKVLAKVLRPAGGILALAAAAFLFFRGHPEVGNSTGARGLGFAWLGSVCLDWSVPAHAKDRGPGLPRSFAIYRDGARS